MLNQVVFEEYWRGIKVSAYTDMYAYDPEDDALLFISLAGTEQAVKAISSAIIGDRTVTIRSEGNSEITAQGNPASRFRVFSTKLSSGAVHQLVADTRFFENVISEHFVIIPQGQDLWSVVYSQVLSHLASPLIPEWAPWICRRLTNLDLMREMAGTLRVVEVWVDEEAVDKIISEGVRMGQINLDRTGGTYDRIH
jgi:hypothetical protein